jgi:hypothetical protein
MRASPGWPRGRLGEHLLSGKGWVVASLSGKFRPISSLDSIPKLTVDDISPDTTFGDIKKTKTRFVIFPFKLSQALEPSNICSHFLRGVCGKLKYPDHVGTFGEIQPFKSPTLEGLSLGSFCRFKGSAVVVTRLNLPGFCHTKLENVFIDFPFLCEVGREEALGFLQILVNYLRSYG